MQGVGAYEQQMLLRMLSGQLSSGLVWIQLGVLIGLLAVLILRPERIHGPTLFRWACTFFALSILLPAVVGVILGEVFPATAGRQSAPASMMLTIRLLETIQPTTLAACLFCLFAALTPPRRPQSTRVVKPPAEPAKHPLDD